MKSSRDILQSFFELSASMEENPEIKKRIDAFIATFNRRDLRKASTRIRIWKFLNDLRTKASPDLKDGFEGIMADLTVKWEGSLNRALRENKIREE
ncbi:MAG: hypothetical protein ACTSRW_00515 [Candidatus Helarchaeota archaeon]